MSEPVGNSPRGDVPGNSHRAREMQKNAPVSNEAVEAKEPVEKIIQGEATTRKPPWYKRFARNMIAEDAGSMGDWLLIDVVVPAIKNLLRDTVVGGVDRTLYGASRGRAIRRDSIIGERPSLRTRYDRMSEPEPRRMMSREGRAMHNFAEIVLNDREEAELVIEAMLDRVERYGAASVADLYDFVGQTGSYADRNWGWTDLRTADVRQVRGGWLLDLPRPDLLR